MRMNWRRFQIVLRSMAFLIGSLVATAGTGAQAHLVVTSPTASKPQTVAYEVALNPQDGLKYVRIHAGTFMMGCSPGDHECQADENPVHRVTITKDYWIGQTEVTVGAYKRFSAATGQEIPSAPLFNPDWANLNMPIVSVMWDESRDYCVWAGGRLPTEAEWEYAARGGSTQARYGSLAEIASDSPYGSLPRVVGQKRANGFGLFDMLGNASEWVNDWYDEKYYQHSPSTDPQGPKGDGSKVLRGGPLTATPWIVRVSYRDRKDPGGRDFYDSFRCVWKGPGGTVDSP
jgi:formylglycine-generating enzyme required for sulfatase activity